ncbi:MAG: sulfotransferase [Bacteroidetes bacterium]|nr:sulfotransferase [Bacteroidota bacterium]
MLQTLEKPNNIKIHFIIGSTRSGTTLLQEVLNHHKNCVAMGESKHLLLGYKKYGNMSEVTESLLKDISIYRRKKEIPTFLKIGEKMNYFELCRRIYFHKKENKKEVCAIIDKNPFYTLKTKELMEIVPDAKFLCTIRDYRDFVLSNKQSREHFSKKFSVINYSIIWRFYNKLVLETKKKYPTKTLFVFYENFVENKESVLKEVCSFLSIEYDEHSFNYQDRIKKNIEEKKMNERVLYKYNSLLKPINEDRSGAWKKGKHFAQIEHKIMDFWCGNIGAKLGYKKTTHISFIETVYISIISSFYYLRAWVYFKMSSLKINMYLNDRNRSNI